MPRKGQPRPEWAPWTLEEEEMLCAMRAEFPIESFASIARTLTTTFGTRRTRDACIARWHRIETEDTAIVRKATLHASLRERAKQDRLYQPETPWEDQLPAPPPLPDTPSLPMLKTSHRPPQKAPAVKPWYRDAEKRQEMVTKVKAAQMGYTPAPPRPPQPASSRLVMRVPTIAELDLHRASMR